MVIACAFVLVFWNLLTGIHCLELEFLLVYVSDHLSYASPLIATPTPF